MIDVEEIEGEITVGIMIIDTGIMIIDTGIITKTGIEIIIIREIEETDTTETIMSKEKGITKG